MGPRFLGCFLLRRFKGRWGVRDGSVFLGCFCDVLRGVGAWSGVRTFLGCFLFTTFLEAWAVFHFTPVCSSLFQLVPVFQFVPVWQFVSVCSSLFQFFPVCSSLFHFVSLSFALFQFVPDCPLILFQFVPVSSSLFQLVAVWSGFLVCYRVPVCSRLLYFVSICSDFPVVCSLLQLVIV